MSSVRLSVTLVDCDHNYGWNSSKIISQLVSLLCSLFAHPNITGLRQGEHPQIQEPRRICKRLAEYISLWTYSALRQAILFFIKLHFDGRLHAQERVRFRTYFSHHDT